MIARNEFMDDKICFYLTIECREHNTIFLGDRDFRTYLNLLKRYKKTQQVRIFAFCLLPAAIHLVVQPRKAERLAAFIWDVNREYERYFTKKGSGHSLSWSNRFGCLVIDNDHALFDFIKYLEFLPVEHTEIVTPVEYPWSSCCLRVLGHDSSIVDVSPWQSDDQDTSQEAVKSS